MAIRLPGIPHLTVILKNREHHTANSRSILCMRPDLPYHKYLGQNEFWAELTGEAGIPAVQGRLVRSPQYILAVYYIVELNPPAADSTAIPSGALIV